MNVPPALVDAAVQLVRAMLARSTKDVVAANVVLRRRVDAELIRRKAISLEARRTRG